MVTNDVHTWCFRLIVACLVLPCPLAYGHKPLVIDGGPTGPENAHEVTDPEVSFVGYHERTGGAPELWFTFDIEAGTALYLQLGVPQIERYETLRPAMALLGPGLPPAEVPFELPDGYGGWVYTTEGEDPVIFDEEFTGTTSWQFSAVRRQIDVSGRYYLVGYVPSGEDGKFWMALGEEESFGLEDILNLPATLFQVRMFHEVFFIGGILGWVLLILLGVLLGLFAAVFQPAS